VALTVHPLLPALAETLACLQQQRLPHLLLLQVQC
jgi:hypothetical protein